MDFYDKRTTATLEETLEFCNAVRKAGGANPLDGLMPAIPQDENSCLIALNLNFECAVSVKSTEMSQDNAVRLGFRDKEFFKVFPLGSDSSVCLNHWAMWLDHVDEEKALEIADAMDLPLVFEREEYISKVVYMILPNSIGRVAEAFDCWVNDPVGYEEFTPYVVESIREAMEIGSLNPGAYCPSDFI